MVGRCRGSCTAGVPEGHVGGAVEVGTDVGAAVSLGGSVAGAAVVGAGVVGPASDVPSEEMQPHMAMETMSASSKENVRRIMPVYTLVTVIFLLVALSKKAYIF